jgi:hypothetical protein
MFWVGVRYRGIALPDIMKVMRLWLDQRRLQPKTFEYVISGSGTLVRLQFTQEVEAAEFAQASEYREGVHVDETSTDTARQAGSGT